MAQYRSTARLEADAYTVPVRTPVMTDRGLLLAEPGDSIVRTIIDGRLFTSVLAPEHFAALYAPDANVEVS
jgi:hypothetical protein